MAGAVSPPLMAKRSKSYEHLVFPEWQSRLLMTSSLNFVLASAYAAHLGQTTLSLFLIVAGVNSLNYWRSPGASWWRDTDLTAAIGGLLYCLYAGFWLADAPCLVAFASLLSGLFCFRRSWNLSLGHNEVWAFWHAGAHALSGMAAVTLALGDVADKGTALTPPHNLVAECSVAAILITLVADLLRPEVPSEVPSKGR
ncbi:hypothetical protein T492DRAFT_973773 [Pavlovales sp. CCMP2436]|nr:hypothetical protein T492DRAFT_973773 [Pavlovales sp. CCMP2436]